MPQGASQVETIFELFVRAGMNPVAHNNDRNGTDVAFEPGSRTERIGTYCERIRYADIVQPEAVWITLVIAPPCNACAGRSPRIVGDSPPAGKLTVQDSGPPAKQRPEADRTAAGLAGKGKKKRKGGARWTKGCAPCRRLISATVNLAPCPEIATDESCASTQLRTLRPIESRSCPPVCAATFEV